MKNKPKVLTLLVLGWLLSARLAAQNANCNDGTVTGNETYSGAVFFNYGGVVNAFSTKNSTTHSIGEPILGSYINQQYNGVFGFYSRFLLPPLPPEVSATEGDLNDRIQVSWTVDPLSPSSELGFNIYRDGAFIYHLDKEIRVFVDFNVQAGQFYHYEVRGVNSFGEGNPGEGLGFLNPNGVITGQVRTFSGTPVLGAGVILTPTLGNALEFSGSDVAFAEYDSVLQAATWSVSCWVKIGSGNNNSSILDFGSSVQKNWWMTTNGTSKGVKFNVGNGSSVKTATVDFNTDPDGWHHVAATYSGQSLLLYLDGNLVATLGSTPIVYENLPLFFGRKQAALSNYFTGSLDEVRIFRRQLSQTEINQYKNRTVNSDAQDLAAYWKFDEGVGSKGYDISGKRLKVYLCGTEWSDDRPEVVNGAVTDESGFYKIEGINYGGGTTFTATPSKTAYENYALEFNAANEQYAVLTDSVLKSPQNAAIELRVQSFETTTSTRTLLANENNTGSQAFLRFNVNNGNISLNLNGENKNLGVALGTGYQHLVVNLKKNGSGTDVILYKNGVLATTTNYSVAIPNFEPQTWQLGARKTAGGYDQFFSGLIDEVAFYDTLLTDAEVQANHIKGANATHPHLRSWFPLNENHGVDLEDIGPDRTGFGVIHGALWSNLTGITAATDHAFQPDKRLVTLNPSNTSSDLVDFTDLSTVAVSGYVRYEGTDCYVKGVEILVDGASASPKIFTDSTGRFVADFEPGKSAILSPKLGEHVFAPASWQLRNLNAPVAGILFKDQTKRKISGKISGGLCQFGLLNTGQVLQIKVATPGTNPCFERIITLNGDDEGGDKTYEFDNLPPRELNVSIIFCSNTDIYTYFQSQGGETVDLLDANYTVDFNYTAPPKIEVVDGLDVNTCGDPMIEQLQRYNLRFKVYQAYAGGNCYLDEAAFNFDNQLSYAPQQKDTLMGGGNMRYSFIAGEPRLDAPFTKTLTVTAMQADSQAVVINLPAVVLGQRATGTTFATTAPQMPFVILRDPPGDASYATIEKGETTCNSMTLSTADGNDQSHEVSVVLGEDHEIATGIGVAVLSKVIIENTTNYTLTGTLNQIRDNSMQVCMTANTVISTNSADDLVGRDADVFVGGAINFDFGMTNILKFDADQCNYYIEKGVIAAPTGLATTYIYQRYDIIHTVIPNLEASMLPTAQADIDRWLQILATDDALQTAAVFDENISFTGGVVYEKSLTAERTESWTETSEDVLSHAVGNAFGFTFNGTGLGYKIAENWTFGKTTVQDSTVSSATTVGYVLNDDDIGDLYSVTVKRDKRYGTPVFQLVSGETSCPWEAPTQKRNVVSFNSNTTSIVNLSSNEAAVFNLSLGNASETDEERTYTLSIGSNPLGALVKAEGQQLTATGLDFTIPAGQSVPVKLTVERGVLSYDYQDIEVVLAATCEDPATEGFAKSLFLDVSFVEPCSEVNIAFPLQNDVINTGTVNPYQVTFDGYDENDPDLQLIRVQYRPKFGDGSWINIQPESDVLTADLNDVSTTLPWDIGTLNDGQYELRALTQCFGGNQAPGISKIIDLRVEKQSPGLLGLPQPADGILSQGDEISITFNEQINCAILSQADSEGNNNVGLYDAETGDLIDAVISCFENKIVIVPNIQNKFIEGKTLRVMIDDIEDLAGNNFVHTQWEFYVDRSPLAFETANLEVTMYEGEEKTVFGSLKNVSGSMASFEISGIPSWVSIFPNTGSLLPGEDIEITYKFPKNLPQGDYLDTIYFNNSQGNERVSLHLRVLCTAPEWAFDPAAYPHAMNLTLQLDIEGELSTDEADIVAAFIDGELRGSAHIQYLPPLDKYLAFLTIFGNDGDADKPVHLEIWDASACLRYGETTEQFTFEPDHFQGNLDAPVNVHTNSKVRRDIPLTSGWNWISFNLALPNNQLDAALASLDHPQNDLIKNPPLLYAEYFNNHWTGSLAGINNTGQFQYRADVTDTIRMLGGLIDPATIHIPINAAWNWIGYVPNYALSIDEALAGLQPADGDIIKGQSSFAQYLDGVGWLGSLKYMEPPKGYQLKISHSGTLTYPPEPANRPTAIKTGLPVANYWTFDPTQFEYSMTLVGMLSVDGQNATISTYELGVFAGTELRGSIQAMYVEALQAYVFFLTAMANTAGEQLQFRLYDAATGQISDLNERVYFAPQQHLGSIPSPFPFTFASSAVAGLVAEPGIEVSPNPFHDFTEIRFRVDQLQEVRMTVTDLSGRLIREERIQAVTGINKFRWDASKDDAGVYFIRIETAQKTFVQKVVKE